MTLPTMSQQGFVMITTLLFLLVIVLLGLEAMEDNILETKMSAYSSNSSTALAAAESMLLVDEAVLRGEPLHLPPTKVMLQNVMTEQVPDRCGRPLFIIAIVASYQNAIIRLESEYQLAHHSSAKECADLPAQQLWWRQY